MSEQRNREMINQEQEPSIAVGTSYIDRIFLEMGLISPADNTFLEFVREMHTHGHQTNLPEASNSESVMPELIDFSEDEFESRANDSSEDEFDFQSNGPRLNPDFAFSQYNQMARLEFRQYQRDPQYIPQCTEFQARGACHVHGYWQ